MDGGLATFMRHLSDLGCYDSVGFLFPKMCLKRSKTRLGNLI